MRENEEVKLSDAMQKMFGNMNLTDDVMQHSIVVAWNELMSEPIKKRVSKLVFKKGTLYVYVTSSALRNELFMSRYQLRDRLNEQTKSKWIQEVILK